MYLHRRMGRVAEAIRLSTTSRSLMYRHPVAASNWERGTSRDRMKRFAATDYPCLGKPIRSPYFCKADDAQTPTYTASFTSHRNNLRREHCDGNLRRHHQKGSVCSPGLGEESRNPSEERPRFLPAVDEHEGARATPSVP